MKVCIVVPTIRESSIRRFVAEWQDQFRGQVLIVIEDNPAPSFDIESGAIDVRHYSWREIDEDLGDKAWIVPRRTDCIRSFGFLLAHRERPDMIVTLDDDCYPLEYDQAGFLAAHWSRLEGGGSTEAWQQVGSGAGTRGLPYFSLMRRNRVVANLGLWTEVPDYDAPTQLAQSRGATSFEPFEQTIPRGRYFPMCGMNLAFRPELAPALYFLLMGREYEYDRFGDIWCGIFLKRICDHLGLAINSGSPRVRHSRASDVWSNLRKEAPGMEMNERLWPAVDRIVLTKEDVAGCYAELADKLELEGEYWSRLRQAMRLWEDLFLDPDGSPVECG